MKTATKFLFGCSIGYVFYWIVSLMKCAGPDGIEYQCFTGEFHWVTATCIFAIVIAIISGLELEND